MFKNTFKPVHKLDNNNDIKDIKILVNKSLGLDESSMNDESSSFTEISSDISCNLDMTSMPEKLIFTNCCSPVSGFETDLGYRTQPFCNNTSTTVNASSNKKKNPTNLKNLRPYLPKYNKNTQEKHINEFLVSSKDNATFSSSDLLLKKLDETNEITSLSDKNDLNSTFMAENFSLYNSKCTYNSSDDNFNADVLKKERNINATKLGKHNCDVSRISDNSPAEKNSEDSFICKSRKGKKAFSSNKFLEENEQNLESESFPVKSKEHNTNVKHVCPHCSKCFRSHSKLKKHIHSHNTYENIAEYQKINELSRTVSLMYESINENSEATTDSYKIDIRKANCVQKCPYCSSTFKFASKLKRHIKTHVDLKPYECQICSKAFLERFNLLAHVNVHKNEKPHVCDICQRSFSFKSNLTRHLRSHMKKKPFICNECGDAYSSERNLVIHIRNHDGTPFKCTECVKAFKKKSNLKRHSKIHLKERKYQCDLCDYAARRNFHLKRHIKRKHKK